jgi:enoyl-CoA hydratase/carnithine racemase
MTESIVTESIVTELDQGVLIIRLNRTAKKNALTAAMYTVMADAIEQAQRDSAIKVLLYTGSEGVFTAGNDLHDFLENPPAGPDSPVNRFIANMVATDVPIVAAVDGVAVGIGTTMLLHFDQVLATHGARFSLPFINLALVPEAGSSMLLVETCGYRKAAEMLMLGEPFSAQEALEYGIVSQLCEPGELMARALAVAHKLAAKPKEALRATKRLLRRSREPLERRVRAEAELFSRRLESAAAKEAMNAFFEKRAPNFQQFD